MIDDLLGQLGLTFSLILGTPIRCPPFAPVHLRLTELLNMTTEFVKYF